jgi:hypothetical protein
MFLIEFSPAPLGRKIFNHLIHGLTPVATGKRSFGASKNARSSARLCALRVFAPLRSFGVSKNAGSSG